MTGTPTKTVDKDGNATHRDSAGELHREDGPAVVWINGSKWWYLHGECHREDGPAGEWADGSKWWYLHGKLHREDGPAVVGADGYKAWHLHGKWHRENGPAVVGVDGSIEWYLHDVKVNREKYEHVRTCSLEELPEYIGTPYECLAKKRLGK